MNDTICMTFTGLPIISIPWSDNFDTIPNYWVNPDGNKQWEHGIPSASKINYAYSNPNVWATNLNGQYSGNNYDNLYSPFFDFSQAEGATLKFRHWIEAQSGDGGNVQFSTDGGNSWSVLGTMSNPNWYTNNINGTHCWSGTSSGWQLATYNLDTFDYHPTPIQFRFYFFSDASVNDDGWAIDDFAIVLPKIPKDAGVVKIITPVDSTVIASNVSVQIRIKNFGTDTLNSIPVNYAIIGQATTTETWTGLLLPDSTVNYTFTTAYTVPITNYDLCAWTSLVNDIYTNNDSICKNISTIATVDDVGIISIIQPDSFTLINSNVTVIAKVQNFGTNTITSIPVEYDINGINPVQAIWSGNLLPDSTENYTFTTTYNSLIGNYTLCVRTELFGDTDSTNNAMCKSIYGTSGIESILNSSYKILITPNPSKGKFKITTTGISKDFQIKVYNIKGQEIQNRLIHQKENIILDLSSEPKGIYFIRLWNNDFVMVEKVVLQ